jgi:hypothetical protein
MKKIKGNIPVPEALDRVLQKANLFQLLRYKKIEILGILKYACGLNFFMP